MNLKKKTELLHRFAEVKIIVRVRSKVKRIVRVKSKPKRNEGEEQRTKKIREKVTLSFFEEKLQIFGVDSANPVKK